MLPCRLNEAIALELPDLRHAEELFVDGTRSADDTREFIKQTQRQWAEHNGVQTAILEHETIVGVIGLPGVDWANRSTSVGYWLSERAQGRGVMTTACQAFARHAFEALSLNRVEIRCAVDNGRSRAIPERLRFTFEGMLRATEWLYDHFVDHAVYGMLASEWRRTAA